MKANLKKRGLFFGFLFVIVMFLGFVSAVTSGTCDIVPIIDCDDPVEEGHAVMGVYAQTNSHAEIITQTNYLNVLCCNLGSSDTMCSDLDSDGDIDNKILGLSEIKNAHLEVPTATNYDNDVCYGGVTSCTWKDNVACSGSFPIPVASLSGQTGTNAHVGQFNDYSIKICCSQEIPPPTQTFCGDNSVQTPNDQGQNEECDKSLNCIAPQQEGECTCRDGFEPDGNGNCNEIAGEFNCIVIENPDVCNSHVGDETAIESVRDARRNNDGLSCPDRIIGNSCVELSNCRCEWNIDESKCLPKVDNIDCTDPDNPRIIGSCSYDNPEDDPLGDCSSGQFQFVTYTWTADWIVEGVSQGESPQNSCENGENTIACPARTQLPFFTFGSFVITILGLILVYLVLIKRKIVIVE